MIFETHAHYDDKAFDGDRDEVIGGLYAQGVDRVINCGADLASSHRSIELAGRYGFIRAAVGVHPDEIGELFGLPPAGDDAVRACDGQDESGIDAESILFDSERVAELEALADDAMTVAVGEIGLDYHWNVRPQSLQKRAFTMQWELAVKKGLPVIIHSRDAAQDTMEIVRGMYEKEKAAGRMLRADMHCYSYSPEQAEEYLKMGLMFGIGGVLTFKNAKKLKETAAILPIERILLETDCPYMAPEPYRGTRNNSAYIRYVAQMLADIKGITPEEVCRITHHNAESFFTRM